MNAGHCGDPAEVILMLREMLRNGCGALRCEQGLQPHTRIRLRLKCNLRAQSRRCSTHAWISILHGFLQRRLRQTAHAFQGPQRMQSLQWCCER